MQSKCWARHTRFLRRAIPFGQLNRHALYSHRKMFQTCGYGKTLLASDRKLLLCPNLAFMFRLLESCKVNFGKYIVDIEDGTDVELTKTSQAVA